MLHLDDASHAPCPRLPQVTEEGCKRMLRDQRGCSLIPALPIRLPYRTALQVMEGYKWMFRDQLVTVWSAPNYCYR